MQKVTIWRNRLFIFIGALFAFYIAINAFLFFGGKNIITERIKTITGKKTAIGFCYLRPPLVIAAKNVNMEGLMKADGVSCSLSALNLFWGKLVFNRLVLSRPEIYYEIKQQPDKASPQETVADATITKPEKSPQILLRAVQIKSGKIDFTDYRSADIPIRILARNVDVNLDGSGLKVHARLPWESGQQEGKIEAVGSFQPAENEATANLNISNINAAAVYPYFSKWISLKNNDLQGARLDFSAHIKVAGTNLQADCKLILSDFARKSKAQAPSRPDKRTVNFNLMSRFAALQLTLGNVDLIFLDNLQ